MIHCTDPSSLDWPDAAGSRQAEGTAAYFADGSGGRAASAHYVEDVDSEAHCVPDSTVAYHAPPNSRSLGIEICGRAHWTREQWLSPKVWPAVARAAARTRELCDRHRVPTVRIGPAELRAGRKGVCGHIDISHAWGRTTHTDPGDGFPWPEFMAAVTGGAPAPAPDDDGDDDMFTEADRTMLEGVSRALLIDIAEGRDDVTEGGTLAKLVRSVHAGDFGERTGFVKGSLGWLDRRLARNRRGVVADVLEALADAFAEAGNPDLGTALRAKVERGADDDGS